MSSGAKPTLSRKKPIGALTDGEFPFRRIGLAGLVEGHDNGGGAIAQDAPRMLEEGRFALLQADRVDECVALVGLSPASITGHFEESIITGTRECQVPRR